MHGFLTSLAKMRPLFGRAIRIPLQFYWHNLQGACVASAAKGWWFSLWQMWVSWKHRDVPAKRPHGIFLAYVSWNKMSLCSASVVGKWGKESGKAGKEKWSSVKILKQSLRQRNLGVLVAILALFSTHLHTTFPQ